jgi:hypothetical protein
MTRREQYRRQLHSLYKPRYDALCGLLGEHWQPFEGFRTFAEQQDLYERSRTSSKWLTNAREGESAHNWGCASHWTLWDERRQPIWDVKDPRWKEYVNACQKVGLARLDDLNDHVHNHLPLAVPWKRVGQVYLREGLEAALKLIAETAE